MKYLLFLTIYIFLFFILKVSATKEGFNTVELKNIPILIISKENKFKQSKTKLENIGFYDIKHINPVIINNDHICKDRRISLSELGCAEAHKNCFREIKKTGKPTIILEEDWTYSVDDNVFKDKILKYYNIHIRDSLDITFLGHYGDSCIHAYIVSPKCCDKLISINNCSLPTDTNIYSRCNTDLKCVKVKHESSVNDKLYFGKGLIVQDRINNIGMHDHNNNTTFKFNSYK